MFAVNRPLAAVLGCVFLIVAGAGAASLPEPTGKPILTVVGKIGVANKDGAAEFDIRMLEALGTVAFETSTPWYEGRVKFEGVPLTKLMAAVGATGETVVAVALNDYSAEIPVEDFAKYGPILALKRDGAYMPVRDKGPLFLVYPYDSSEELRQKKFYTRSVWQIARLEVK